MTQSEEIIKYIEKTYGDQLEFLWQNSKNSRNSKNAIWRCPKNRKWYGALLPVKRSRLWKNLHEKLDGEEEVEVLDLRFYKHEALDFVEKTPGVYPGYHMNKNSWITIILDGSVETGKICALIDLSHDLAEKA